MARSPSAPAAAPTAPRSRRPRPRRCCWWPAGRARRACEPGLDRHGNLWALPRRLGRPAGDRRARTSTPSPTAAATTGRWGPCWASSWPTICATPAATPPALLVCAAEEAPRFGAGTIGSRLLVGTLAEAALVRVCTTPTGSARRRPGRRTSTALAELPRIEPPLERLRAHAEIHVAQRRALRELGVVTRVASPRRFEVEFDGRGRPLPARWRWPSAATRWRPPPSSCWRSSAPLAPSPPETVATVGHDLGRPRAR